MENNIANKEGEDVSPGLVFSEKQNHQSSDEGKNSALHFFLYLVLFLSLAFVSSGLGSILYQIINKFFPDQISGYSYTDIYMQGVVKFGMASIIIAAPIFFVISYLISSYLYKGNIAENSKVRKWTTYIVLIITVAVILGDLIALVFNWLGGDTTVRFLLKALVVLFIAGFIFGYYFWDMRKKNMLGVKYAWNKAAATILAIIAVGIFFSSFFLIDSPSIARDKKSDVAIMNDMTSYKYSIETYFQKNKSLPVGLGDLEFNTYTTPIKGSGIVYKKTGDFTYQLCTNFKTSNLLDNNGYDYSNGIGLGKHDKGNKCFDQEIGLGLRDSKNPYPLPTSDPSFKSTDTTPM